MDDEQHTVPPWLSKQSLVPPWFSEQSLESLRAYWYPPDPGHFVPREPPSRWQRFKTRVSMFRERLGERAYELLSGHEFPDDWW